MAAASVLSALSLACSGAPDEPLPTSISFAHVPPGDVVHVQLVSIGCWGDTAFEFEFVGGAQPRMSAVRLSGRWSDETQQFLIERRSESRELALLRLECEGLDELLRYYRSGPGEGCSDQRVVTLAQVRGERTLISEQYIDNRCGDDEIAGATTLWQLIPRFNLPQ